MKNNNDNAFAMACERDEALLFDDEPLFLENIFTVFNAIGCFYDGLSLPDDVKKALYNVADVCEPYIKNGFSYTPLVID